MIEENRLMTPREAHKYFVIAYPALFGYSNKEYGYMYFLHHIFNAVCGKYDNASDFVEEFKLTQEKERVLDIDISKLYDQENDIYFCYGASKIENSYEDPVPEAFLGVYNEKELKEMSVAFFEEPKMGSFFEQRLLIPHPNFKKENSFIWKSWVKEVFDENWVNEAKYFYSKCEDFFESENIHLYHGFYPKETQEGHWKRMVGSYEDSLEIIKNKAKKDNMDFGECVKNVYGVYPNRDIVQFIKNRGDKEKERCLSFINETKHYLSNM